MVLNRGVTKKMSYKILAKTISNDRVLTFTNVKSYIIKDGFLKFVDSKSGKMRSFRVEGTEIEEEWTLKLNFLRCTINYH